MKLPFAWVLAVCSLPLCTGFPLLASDQPPPVANRIRVLVVTGGHGFEKEPFLAMFKANPDISFQTVTHPQSDACLKADAARNYDVLVLYDYGQTISEEAQADFVARLKEGKGLVVLHHAIATYPNWQEYAKIIGARYYLEKTVVDGVVKPRSAYQHGLDFCIHIADTNHPVTRGLKDFPIRDETYRLFDVAPESHPLLTTEEPESNKVVGWAKTYEAARVVYLQSGHDHFAYENPSYRQLVRQAIRWAAKKT
jgi:uncharacterized protein